MSTWRKEEQHVCEGHQRWNSETARGGTLQGLSALDMLEQRCGSTWLQLCRMVFVFQARFVEDRAATERSYKSVDRAKYRKLLSYTLGEISRGFLPQGPMLVNSIPPEGLAVQASLYGWMPPTMQLQLCESASNRKEMWLLSKTSMDWYFFCSG